MRAHTCARVIIGGNKVWIEQPETREAHTSVRAYCVCAVSVRTTDGSVFKTLLNICESMTAHVLETSRMDFTVNMLRAWTKSRLRLLSVETERRVMSKKNTDTDVGLIWFTLSDSWCKTGFTFTGEGPGSVGADRIRAADS